MSKKTYTIPCTWSVVGTITVQADNLQDAITEAEDAPLPEDSEYLEDSFQIEHDMIPYHNENLTAEEKQDCNVIKF